MMIDEIAENKIFQYYNVHRITTAQKIRTNFTPRQVYLLGGQAELFTYTTANLLPDFSRARTKIWSNYTTRQA